MSVFLVPITFIPSETEGQHWVTPPTPQSKVLDARPPTTLSWLSCRSTPFKPPPLSAWHASPVDGAGELNLLLLNVPFPSDVISQKSRAPFSGQPAPASFLRRSQLPNYLRAGQVALPKAGCKAPSSSSSSSLEKKEFFRKPRKPDKTEDHSSKI